MAFRPRGDCPINVKYLIEGEEEVGSAALSDFVAENTEKLACDCIVVSDCCQFAPGQPAITYGLRGIACLRNPSSRDPTATSIPGLSADRSPILPWRCLVS